MFLFHNLDASDFFLLLFDRILLIVTYVNSPGGSVTAGEWLFWKFQFSLGTFCLASLQLMGLQYRVSEAPVVLVRYTDLSY